MNDTADKDYYNFGGEDFRKLQHSRTSKLEEIEQGWIALPKRERKQLHDLSSLTGLAGSSRDSPPFSKDNKKQPKPQQSRPPPTYKFLDIHFPSPRLLEFFEREKWAWRRVHEYEVPSDPDAKREERERVEQERTKLNTLKALSAEEEAEKQRLLGEVFSSWTRTDFQKLMRGLDNHSINEVEKITPYVERKSVDEVRQYLKVFAERYPSLPDSARIYTRLQRGTERQDRQRKRREAIKIKLNASQFPQLDLKIPYPSGHNKAQQVGLCVGGNTVRMVWTEEEDRFLLCAYAEACKEFPDDCDEMFCAIRDKIHVTREFMFNNLMRSLSMEKVKERLDSLFIWIVKEIFPAPAKQPMENSTASSTLPSTSAFAKPKIPVMKNPTAAKIPSSSPAHTENRTQPVGQHNFPKTFTLQYADGKGKGQFAMKGPTVIDLAAATGDKFVTKNISVVKDGDAEVRTFVIGPSKLSGMMAAVSGKTLATKSGSVKTDSSGKSQPKPQGSGKKSTETSNKIPEWAKPAAPTGEPRTPVKVPELKLKRKASPDSGSDPDEEIPVVEVSPPSKKLAVEKRA